MTGHAQGTFDVKLTPQLPEDKSEGSTLGRMLLDKQFHGDLEAVSHGQMLTGMTAVQGSGAYVAIERVTGTLNGRRGSFILHHLGIMVRGAPHAERYGGAGFGHGRVGGAHGRDDHHHHRWQTLVRLRVFTP